MRPSERRKTIRPLQAGITVVYCLAAVALIGASLDRPRAPAAGKETEPPAPAVPQTVPDPERAAYRVASVVAAASDTGGPILEVPPCRRVLADPTETRCARYEDALEDFLEDARRPCTGPDEARAEDLSCGRSSGYFGLPRGLAVGTTSSGKAR